MKAFVLFVCGLFYWQCLVAQPGNLNTAFGNNGYLMINMDTLFLDVVDFRLHNSDKITVLGKCYRAVDNSFAGTVLLFRLNANGTLDGSFGTNGVVEFSNSSYLFDPKSLHVYNDGSVIVAGTRQHIQSLNERAFVQKYTSTGAYDYTFSNSHGIIELFNNTEATIRDMEVDDNGRIYVCGHKSDPPAVYNKSYIARLLPSGVLDNTYSGDGIAIVDFGMHSAFSAMAITSTAMYAVGGAGNNMMAACVRHSDGALNTSFDSDGKMTFQINSSQEYPLDVQVHSSNGIFICGYTQAEPFIAKVGFNGSLASNFGTNGTRVIPFGGSFNMGISIALSPTDQDMYVAIQEGNANQSRVIRINRTTGQNVLAFGSNGTKDISYFGNRQVSAHKLMFSGNKLYMLNATFTPTVVNFMQPALYVMNGGSGGDLNVFQGNTTHKTISAVYKTTESLMQVYSQGQKLLVLGAGINPYEGKYYGGVRRYQTDGTQDLSFHSTLESYYRNYFPLELLVNQDESFYTAGYFLSQVQGSDRELRVHRHKANGHYDSSFATNGRFSHFTGATGVAARALKTLQDGSVIVAGNMSSQGNSNTFVMKLTASGLLDLNFDGDGIWNYTPGPDVVVRVHDAFIDHNGYIVLVCHYSHQPSSTSDVLFITLSPDGSVIGSPVFAQLQENNTSMIGSIGRIRTVHLPDGRFYLLTSDLSNQLYGLTLARFHPNTYALDLAFGNNGYRKITINQAHLIPAGITMGQDSKPLFIYTRGDFGALFNTSIVHRTDTLGNDDNTFSFDGMAFFQGSLFGTNVQGVVAHTDGNIYLGGTTLVGLDHDFLLSSLEGDGIQVGITEQENPLPMTLYPNPAGGSQVNIRMNTIITDPTDIYLTDSKGSVISALYSGVPDAEQTLPLPSGLPAGHYFVRVQNIKGVFHLPLIYTGK